MATTLDRGMNRFGKLGFIDYKGEFQIRSSPLDVVLQD